MNQIQGNGRREAGQGGKGASDEEGIFAARGSSDPMLNVSSRDASEPRRESHRIDVGDLDPNAAIASAIADFDRTQQQNRQVESRREVNTQRWVDRRRKWIPVIAVAAAGLAILAYLWVFRMTPEVEISPASAPPRQPIRQPYRPPVQRQPAPQRFEPRSSGQENVEEELALPDDRQETPM